MIYSFLPFPLSLLCSKESSMLFPFFPLLSSMMFPIASFRCCFPISFLFSRSLLCSMHYRCICCCVRCAVRCATSAFCLMLCSFFTLLRRCCVRCCVPGATTVFCSMLFSFFTLLDALCSVRCCVPFYVAESLLYSMRFFLFSRCYAEYGYKIASCCSMKILHILTKP